MPALNSINAFIGTGAQTNWEFNFAGGYLSPTHVRIIRGTVDTPAVLTGASTVSIIPAVPAGEKFYIVRRTPNVTPIVDFAAGARLTEGNLDTIAKQAVFVAAEAIDRGEGALAEALPRALLVPVGEIAPVLPPMAERAGKVLSFASDGSIVGVAFGGTTVELSTPFIIHEGQTLDGVIDSLRANLTTTQANLSAEIASRAVVGSGLASLTTSATATAASLASLQTAHNTLSLVVDALSGSSPGAGLATLITNEQTSRIAGDAATAATIGILGAVGSGGASFVLNLANVQVSPTETLATRLSTLSASDTAAFAAIAVEQAARVADDAAEVTARTALAATLRAETAAAVAAGVATETTARVAADSAAASQINSLTVSYNNAAASIVTLQSAQASLSGLYTQYGVSLDVNGYITGFVQNNNGTSGTFKVLADRFTIGTPGTDYTPFEVSGGVVRIKDAVITNLSVGKLTTGIMNADILVGAGKIVWSNGVNMKVTGVGFGTANQFLEWFGPAMAYNLCSEANAIQYLKTNGSAYFGGSLSAGVLRTAVQNPDISAAASVVSGTFGSNGGSISVTLSISYDTSSTVSYAATTGGRSAFDSAAAAANAVDIGGGYYVGTKAITGTASVLLERSLAGGAYTTATTLSVSGGTSTFTGQRPVPGDVATTATTVSTFGGSLTYTDPAASTANRQYRATITSRSLAVATTQRLALSTTE